VHIVFKWEEIFVTNYYIIMEFSLQVKHMVEDGNGLFQVVVDRVYGDVEMYNVLHKTIDTNPSFVKFDS